LSSRRRRKSKQDAGKPAVIQKRVHNETSVGEKIGEENIKMRKGVKSTVLWTRVIKANGTGVAPSNRVKKKG